MKKILLVMMFLVPFCSFAEVDCDANPSDPACGVTEDTPATLEEPVVEEESEPAEVEESVQEEETQDAEPSTESEEQNNSEE